MKLATSTGDFTWYVSELWEKVACFKNSKFRNINLELTTNGEVFFIDDEEALKTYWEKLESEREKADVKFVVAHAPCLHTPIPEALDNPENKEYKTNIRAFHRALEVCY